MLRQSMHRGRFITSTRTSAGFRVRAAPGQEEKMKDTLTSLDALLGPAAQPAKPAVPASKPSAPASAPAAPSAASTSAPSAPAAPSTVPAPLSRTAELQKQQDTFERVMGFEGYAPEVINGRCAMIGFVAAFLAESKHGESLFSQLLAGGAGQALLVFAAVTLASFAPAIRKVPFEDLFGKGKQPPSLGPFTADAEIRNGRAAMIGLALLIFLEGASNQAFFM